MHFLILYNLKDVDYIIRNQISILFYQYSIDEGQSSSYSLTSAKTPITLLDDKILLILGFPMSIYRKEGIKLSLGIEVLSPAFFSIFSFDNNCFYSRRCEEQLTCPNQLKLLLPSFSLSQEIIYQSDEFGTIINFVAICWIFASPPFLMKISFLTQGF